jgi:hypothetical protein
MAIQVRLLLHDNVPCDGILFHRELFIKSVRSWQIWVNFDASLGIEDMFIKDGRIKSLEVVSSNNHTITYNRTHPRV